MLTRRTNHSNAPRAITYKGATYEKVAAKKPIVFALDADEDFYNIVLNFQPFNGKGPVYFVEVKSSTDDTMCVLSHTPISKQEAKAIVNKEYPPDDED